MTRKRKLPYPPVRTKPAPAPPVVKLDWTTGCKPIDVPHVTPGWGCCNCYKEIGGAVYNGEQRSHCKRCGHQRCDR